ncbi:MAG: cell division protein ZapA [Sphingopyxis sp.]
MAEVMLHIGGYNYQVACGDGEIEALGRLGNIVNEQIESARLMAGGLTEERQLLFAAILLADKLESAQTGHPPATGAGDHAAEAHAAAINGLADRINTLAARVEAMA